MLHQRFLLLKLTLFLAGEEAFAQALLTRNLSGKGNGERFEILAAAHLGIERYGHVKYHSRNDETQNGCYEHDEPFLGGARAQGLGRRSDDACII